MPMTLLADDIADSSDSAFAAKKNICSKRWSHCPETIVSKGTGTLSVAKEESPKVNDRDVNHRRFPVFDLKDFKDTTPCSRGRMSREDNALAEGHIGTEPRGVAKAKSYQRRALTI